MGISFSTTTTTTTRTRRTNPLEHYPCYPTPYHAPQLHNHSFFDYNNVSYLADPFFQQQKSDERTKVVNSEVNVHKDSVSLEVDDLDPDRFLISFVFDALLDGSITIYYFAKEDVDCRITLLFPETYVPIKVPFRKGLHQEFRQPSGTGIDFRFFALDNLSSPSSRNDVFPIVVSAVTDYIVANRSYIMAHEFTQMQISQVVVGKNHEEQFTAKVIRQLLWSDDVCYELKEIYGLGKSSPGCNENGPGKDCVVCITEPKDTTVLPCRRHMELPVNDGRPPQITKPKDQKHKLAEYENANSSRNVLAIPTFQLPDDAPITLSQMQTIMLQINPIGLNPQNFHTIILLILHHFR